MWHGISINKGSVLMSLKLILIRFVSHIRKEDNKLILISGYHLAA